MLVYMLLNTVLEKAYVGLTTSTMRLRIKSHRAHIRGNPRSSRLYDDMRSYPLECWEAVILERYSDVDALLEGERFWIQACGTTDSGVGYNEAMPDYKYAARFKAQNPGPYLNANPNELGWYTLDGKTDFLTDDYGTTMGIASAKKPSPRPGVKPQKKKADMTPEELAYFRECGQRAVEARGLDFYKQQGVKGGQHGSKGGAAKHEVKATSEEMSRRAKVGRTRGPALKDG